MLKLSSVYVSASELDFHVVVSLLLVFAVVYLRSNSRFFRNFVVIPANLPLSRAPNMFGLPNLAIFDEVRRMDVRQVIYQFLNLAMVVSSALMVWKGLFVLAGNSSPITVVISGSMEPAFHRGDILFLTNDDDEPIRVGDITVFKIEGREIPIVHRVIKVHEKSANETRVLTKGDNNQVDDRGLYAPGQLWLERKHIIGKASGLLPHIGMVTIIMNDYPKVKYAVLGFIGLFVITHREK